MKKIKQSKKKVFKVVISSQITRQMINQIKKIKFNP